ncbi:MAG: hypothetical protein LBU47_07995, partial [Christensenellaceae bacterium]|nr:hypothetical protein [Christensenellaceae bacterium]
EEVELCPECGEHTVVPGEELCAFCLKEMARQELAMNAGEDVVPPAGEEVVELDAASGMNEIVDIAEDEDIPTDEYQEIHRELKIGGEEEEGVEIIDLETAILEEEELADDDDLEDE